MIRGPHHRLRCAAVRPPSRFLFYSFFLLFKEPKKKKPTARKKNKTKQKKMAIDWNLPKDEIFFVFFLLCFFFYLFENRKKNAFPVFPGSPTAGQTQHRVASISMKSEKGGRAGEENQTKKNQIKTRPRIGVLLEMLPESPKLRKQSSDILQETKRYLAEEKKKKGTPSTAASSMITLRSWRYQNGFRGSIQVDAHFLSRFCHRIQSNDRDAITSLLWALIWVAIHSANEFSVPIPNF